MLEVVSQSKDETRILQDNTELPIFSLKILFDKLIKDFTIFIWVIYYYLAYIIIYKIYYYLKTKIKK